ncbi:MAG: hypothetical protein ACM3U2_21580 [Deltaproteobacteria bacterium]
MSVSRRLPHAETRRRAHFGLLASVAILAFLYPAAGARGADDERNGFPVLAPQASPKASKAWRTLSKPTTVEFVDLPLRNCLRFVQEYHNFDLHREDDAIAAAGIQLDRPVTLHLQGTSLNSVLRLLLEPADLDFFVDDTGMVITTRERAAAHLSEFYYPLGDVAQAGIPLADLAEAIIQTVDPAGWQKNGGKGSLRVDNRTLYVRQRAKVQEHLEELLRELFDALRDPRIKADDARLVTDEYRIGFLQSVGIADGEILKCLNERLLGGNSPNAGEKETAAIKGNRLILTQPAWMHSAVEEFFERFQAIRDGATLGRADFPGRLDVAASLLSFEAKRRIALKRLAQPVTAQFLDMPLEDELLFLKEASHTQIFVTEEVRGAPGVRDAPVTTKIDKEALSSALDKVLQPLKLDWYLFDADLIVITSHAAAAGRMEPRVYRTRELLAAGQTEKGLVAQISAIEPDSWSVLGGPGQMRSLPGVLIVTQNRRIHEQIGRLLASLERGRDKPAK